MANKRNYNKKNKSGKKREEEVVVNEFNLRKSIYAVIGILCFFGLFFLITFGITNNNSEKKEENENNEVSISYDEILLGRSLSPVEISRIREWVSYGFTDEQIINALKDALSKGKKSLNSVDKILLSYQVRDDVTSEGISTINKDWNKNLEETIRIAKTPWLDDDK